MNGTLILIAIIWVALISSWLIRMYMQVHSRNKQVERNALIHEGEFKARAQSIAKGARRSNHRFKL